MESFDVVIIGAGPSGACAGAMLVKQGVSVCIIEKEQFPRFSIGESLLPHCMEFLAEADLLTAVEAQQFQFKNGAAFYKDGQSNNFDFTEKFSPGPGTTFQVQRATFDKALADEAERKGVEIRYQHTLLAYEEHTDGVKLTIDDSQQGQYQLNAKFVLDASGFGRVLPNLLDLEYPSEFPVRKAIFSHFDDAIVSDKFDRDKILITVHPTQQDIWYWLIPFANGTASIGVVGRVEQLIAEDGESTDQQLWRMLKQDKQLTELLVNAKLSAPARTLSGYSANVSKLADKRFALLGNAGEFLDPVFSSGVTIALRSASQAVPLVCRVLQGEDIDWQQEYTQPLRQGINTFKCFVKAWYDGRLQDVIFHQQSQDKIKGMISAILAGYAWDMDNPFVSDSERRLSVLAEICQAE